MLEVTYVICPVCGKRNVLGVESCAKCGVTLRVVAEPLSFGGSQVFNMGVLEDDERRDVKEDRPDPE